ncbi:MAG TPA: methyltransferase domain-containing protein [Eoetvoesiella sp.]|jgi:phospholipid N-methyltransferase|uniref:class I SAM-dependent methyltransferase n=1 Tax=Eoetvoesiella sp. TaxID=1966355 RepID=UPI002CCF6907|nr:methyltransferase domain-containing protein [Eoetvoesiella sp.]HWK61142.1 methyltransferase domain-containing protein [Eoetvoesiella sp.]
MHRVLRFERAQRMKEYIRNLAPGIFLQELINRPSSVGAICPSSRFLASNMARQVPVEGEGLVIELGAGTGVVTQALLKRGIPVQDLLVVEFSPVFVQRLRQRFQGLNIVHGNAADLCQLVPPERKIKAIVSSLPLCSLPPTVTQVILQQWQALLQPHGVAVQFSYHLREPKWREHLDAQRTHSKIVWANLPPANISTFSFKAPA